MFESLTDRFDRLFRKFGSKKLLSEKEIEQFLADLRGILLGADVHLDAVKVFVDEIRREALEERKISGVTPTEQMLSKVGKRLIDHLGGEGRRLQFTPDAEQIVMLVGLQGTGKTTTAAKLARAAQKKGCSPLLVALDWKRPAAMQQLKVLGERIGVQARMPGGSGGTLGSFAKEAVAFARERALSPVILDTAGRLHVDEELMAELVEIKNVTQPTERLFVADGAVGQDVATQAKAFHSGVDLTGIILTKLDGDARGGAALSIKTVTGQPIVSIGVGEDLEALEDFHPSRMASRILGYGDLESLFEKVQDRLTADKEARMQEMLRTGRFGLDDFKEQLRQVTSLGPLESMLKMIPGVGKMLKGGADMGRAEKDLKKTLAVIDSMTKAERAEPMVLDGRRRRRVARGSGTKVEDVNRVLNQYQTFKKAFREMAKMGPGDVAQEDLMKVFGRAGLRM